MTLSTASNKSAKILHYRRCLASSSYLALALAMGSTALVGVSLSTPAAAADWTGAVSQDWFATGNWSTGALPTAGDNVVVPLGNNDAPRIDGANAQAAGVIVSDTAMGHLVIVNGGTLSSDSGIIANQAGSVGGINVSGAGSAWTNSSTLTVGNLGSVGNLGYGVLGIDNGGAVSNTAGIIGAGAGSAGFVRVDGAGSTWTNSQDLFVGLNGAGTLTISNGGAVSSFGGLLGYYVGSSGTATVDGVGSTWTTSSVLNVGRAGTGTLTISNGGAVSNTYATIGSSSVGTGTATVTDAGSTWTNSGSLDVGDVGVGTLNVLNGGKVSNTSGTIGKNAGSTGTATVDGAGSTWTNSTSLTVGLDGTGTLTISNGGMVISPVGTVGANAGSIGTAMVDGAGSVWTNNVTLTLGQNGTGSLTVSNGGTVNSAAGDLGYYGTATGTATVTGAGSTWANTAALTIGRHGAGTLNVLNGGAVSSASSTLGAFASGTGTATVDGAGSTWTNSTSLTVGLDGTGTLTISNGGMVISPVGTVGANAGSIGTAMVDGAGSVWTNNVTLTLGQNGTGSLTVSNGGTVNSAAGDLGYYGTATGTATVTGAGSTWANTAALTIGRHGAGTLNVLNGGAVSSASSTLGAFASGTGTATVDGAGSTWTNSADLTVGGEGTGALTISNGAVVSSNFGYVGLDAGSTGSVTVTGVGSTWTSGIALNVGYDGTGTLTIAAGGTVTADSGKLGLFAGGTGTVIVDGAGSTLTYANDLVLGFSGGTGVLSIQNGGKVANQDGTLGSQPGSIGTAHVAGAGSTWTNTGNLVVGHHATGTLVISSGGVVTSASSQVGRFDDAIGTATVDGAGSTWTNSADLTVGGSGPGTLTIANDGVVSVGGAFVLAGDAGSIGTLNIGSAAGAPATGTGTLNAATVQFGSGTGAINFNHTATRYTFAPVINGHGTINQIAGNTNLTADSSGFTGATHVSGGRLAVNGSLANSVATVSGGGMLGGNGTVGGILAQAGGIVAPGNSIGILNVAGNVAFAAGSAYQVEVNAAGQSDRIVASGTATLNGGAVSVQDATGFYALGSHYTILTAAGGVTGAFAGASATRAVPFLSFGLSYDPSNVYLDISRSNVSFASVGWTPNEIATGGGVDSLGIGGPLVGALVQLDLPQARAAFTQLSGEVHASAKGVMIEDSRFLREATLDRLRAAFDSVGAASAPVMAQAGGRSVPAPATTDRFAVWGRGFGSWGRLGGDGNAATIKRDIGGFVIGADGLVADSWRLGVIGGYSRSSFRVADRNASGASDNFHAGLYGGTQWGNLAFRSGVAYTWHDIGTHRSVAFPGFSDTLKGDYSAGTTQAFGELGYRIKTGQVAFEPFANLAYVNLSTNGFRETGGVAALASHGGSTGVTFTTLGLRAAMDFSLGNGMNLTARGMLGWRHAFGDTAPSSTMAFSGGSPFTIAGVPLARDAAVIEAGFDFNITPNATLGFAYGGQFGNRLTDQTIRGNLAVKF